MGKLHIQSIKCKYHATEKQFFYTFLIGGKNFEIIVLFKTPKYLLQNTISPVYVVMFDVLGEIHL